MTAAFDITEFRYGRLVAKEFIEKRGIHQYWRFLCDCGQEKIIRRNAVATGNTSSCGCFDKKRPWNAKHYCSGERLYDLWIGMMRRCYKQSADCFKHYGARGISVCAEWHDHLEFKAWAHANGYADDLSIERADNDKDYCPENCSWIPRSQQNKNKRNNLYVEYDGATMCLADAAELSGIHYATLNYRFKRGKRGAALFAPPKDTGRAVKLGKDGFSAEGGGE